MRTITSTLLAAQRVSPQRPRVRLLVRDKQARFTWIGTQAYSAVQASACVVGSTIVVAALDSSGNVRVRLVTDPSILDPTGSPSAGWGHYTGGYTLVATGALGFGNGDVAVSNNGGTLRLFYVKGDGTEVLCRESTDDGVTWGAEATVKAVSGGGASYRYCLASAGNDDVFWCFSRSGYRYVYYRKKSGGVWGSEVALLPLTETSGEFNNCGGLTAVWVSSASKFYLAASFWGDNPDNTVDGRIVTAKFGGTSTTEVTRIVPPGLATVGFTPWWPSLAAVPAAQGGGYVLTYVDKFASSRLSWVHPMAIRSRDFEHWSYKIPLGFTVTSSTVRRMNTVTLAGVLYVHCINEAYKLSLWSSGASGHEMTEGQARVLRYRIYERPGRGALYVDLDNRDGRYDDPGVAGLSAAVMRPLAQVIVEQGLKTSAGDERVECRPFYLWSATRLREVGKNWARLLAVDGYELMRLWRPDGIYLWEGKTLRWCIEELASRIGYWQVDFDGSSEWSQTVEYVSVAGQHTDWSGRTQIRAWGRWVGLDDPAVAFDERINGYMVLQQLLGLVGGVARWGNGDNTERLYCFIPGKQGESPPPVHNYTDGELLSTFHVEGFAWPTRVRAAGDGVAYELQDVPNSLDLGMEIMEVLYSKQWDTAAKCQVAAESALDDADARVTGGWVKTRPNVGVELWDVVTYSDSHAGGGLTTIKRRINGLLTEYVPLQETWEQMLYLEGI